MNFPKKIKNVKNWFILYFRPEPAAEQSCSADGLRRHDFWRHCNKYDLCQKTYIYIYNFPSSEISAGNRHSVWTVVEEEDGNVYPNTNLFLLT